MQLTSRSAGGSNRSLQRFSRQLALGVTALLLTIGTAAQAEPFVPEEDGYVVELLPTAGDATSRELRDLRAQLANKPEDLQLALRLARHYVELGRREFDPRHFGHAEAVLQPWWSLDEAPVEVLVMRATLRQNRHDFATALDDLSAALAADPRNAQAWLTQAVILQVIGRHDEARRSCGRLALLATPLATATCAADVASVSGQAREAYTLLSEVVDADADADPALRQWALTVLAEIALRADDPIAAERHFRSALAAGTKDAYLLGAYADFLLDQGRPAEARDLLVDETRSDPLLLRLALAEKQLGAATLTEHVSALEARFAASRLRGDSVHRREEARFTLHLLGQPQEALQLALANWEVQREVWDARLVLEAALASGAPQAAAGVVAWLHDHRFQDRHIAMLVSDWAEASR